jgi:hypothetical protein
MYGAKLMRNFRAFDTVQVYDAAEVKKYDLPPAGATVRVCLDGNDFLHHHCNSVLS